MKTRRELLTAISVAGAGALLVGCRRTPNQAVSTTNEEGKEGATHGESTPAEVTANEDLMREHGVLRRALIVYRETAARLKQDAASVPAEALEKTALLFRVFGEDYHEKKLEEAYILPVLKKFRGPAAGYVDALMAQHVRGREITDYVLAVTKQDRVPSNAVGPLAAALESFARMYEYHAAIEDTIIFPSWKASLGEAELDELGAKFEEIEADHFGGDDGFESAVSRIQEIETSLGLANLESFSAPAPPKV
ncbi:MAG TPA: hemerythrin domain-containing protein [Pyrinomonadaceae bacterium]|nr:hemerythrin domain-containing protein [Pyrinomonadaceae bacterium]